MTSRAFPTPREVQYEVRRPRGTTGRRYPGTSKRAVAPFPIALDRFRQERTAVQLLQEAGVLPTGTARAGLHPPHLLLRTGRERCARRGQQASLGRLGRLTHRTL